MDLVPYHIDITAAFLHERYEGSVPLYVRPIQDFDGNPIRKDTVLQVKEIFMELKMHPKDTLDGSQIITKLGI